MSGKNKGGREVRKPKQAKKPVEAPGASPVAKLESKGAKRAK